MSTRAAYFFRDSSDHFVVYKHHDGYPIGAAQWIAAARKLAWQGPRFEPDEAAAAFVAANKGANGGSVRLMHKSPDDANIFAACVQCVDIQYAYMIEGRDDADWKVTAYETSFWDAQTAKEARKLWSGPLAKMAAWAKKHEQKEMAS